MCTTDPQKPELALGTLMPLISRIMCHVRQQTSQIYKTLGYDLTPETVEALFIIRHLGGLPQTQLAHILGKDKASVTRILNTLVRSNLVTREHDTQDRRVIRANITDEGKQAFQEIYPAIQTLSDNVLTGIPEHEFNMAVKVCGDIVAGLGCGNEDNTALK